MLVFGIILTSLGVILTVANLYLFFRKLPRRKLEADLEYSTSLIEIGEDVKTDVEVFYKKNKVENIHKTRITFRNLGNREISDSNVLQPITVSIPENTIISFEPSVLSRGFEPELTLNPESPSDLIFRPNYMEIGDRVTIELLSIGKENAPRVKGVIGPPRFKIQLEEKKGAARIERKARLVTAALVVSYLTGLLPAFFWPAFLIDWIDKRFVIPNLFIPEPWHYIFIWGVAAAPSMVLYHFLFKTIVKKTFDIDFSSR